MVRGCAVKRRSIATIAVRDQAFAHSWRFSVLNQRYVAATQRHYRVMCLRLASAQPPIAEVRDGRLKMFNVTFLGNPNLPGVDAGV